MSRNGAAPHEFSAFFPTTRSYPPRPLALYNAAGFPQNLFAGADDGFLLKGRAIFE
jgi:hypothetical protein